MHDKRLAGHIVTRAACVISRHQRIYSKVNSQSRSQFNSCRVLDAESHVLYSSVWKIRVAGFHVMLARYVMPRFDAMRYSRQRTNRSLFSVLLASAAFSPMDATYSIRSPLPRVKAQSDQIRCFLSYIVEYMLSNILFLSFFCGWSC